MRRLVFFVLFLAVAAFGADGKTVPMETLKSAAANYLIERGVSAVKSGDDLSVVYTGKGTCKGTVCTSLFVLAISGSKGWIMMSADDLVRPVLAWSSNTVFDAGNMAPATRAWVHCYENQIACTIRNAAAQAGAADKWKELLRSGQQASARTTSGVGPLLTTTWNQSPYYNDLCPFDIPSSQHTITGCVATAMAQVMKFWNWPAVGCGFHSYNDPGYGLQSADFGATAYQWASMPNSLSGPNMAVAMLMSHAGISVDMYYGTGGSNSMINTYQGFITPCTEFALKANFHYKRSLRSLYRTGEIPGESPGTGPDSITEIIWINDLKTELDEGHPIIYGGFESIVEGHCWVCDGYTTGDLFHFNWGWGGSSDGYYTVDALNPPALGGPGLNINQTAIVGIEPDSFPSDPGSIKLLSPISTSRTPVQFGRPFSVSAKILNSGPGAFTGDFCAEVYDTADTPQGTVMLFTGQTLPTGDSTTRLNFATAGMNDLVTGIYSVRILYRPSGTSAWTPIANNGTYINYTNISVFNDSDMELITPLAVIPGLTLTRYNPISVSTKISDVSWANGGNNVYWPHNIFNGNLQATLNRITDGSVAFTIQTYTSVTIDTDAIVPYTFTNSSLNVPPGTYLLEIRHQYNGTGTYYLTGSTYACNPILVTVAGALTLPGQMNSDEISVYPNPATSELTITAPQKITSIVITDLLGQVLCAFKYEAEQVQVNVTGLPPGVYIAKINETAVRKFVKE